MLEGDAPRILRLARARPVLGLTVVACAIEVVAFLAATRIVPAGRDAKLLADLVYPIMELTALAALLVASRRAPGVRRRRFLLCMAASTLMGVCADASWAVIDLVLHDVPAPSVADVFYVLGLVLLLPALIVEFGSPLRRWRELVDVSIFFCALVFAGLTWLIEPQLRQGLGAATIVAVAESCLAVVAAIAALASLRASRRRAPASVRLIAAAVVVQATSWMVYAYLVQVHGDEDTSWILGGWQLTWSLLTIGAVSSIVGGPQEREVERRQADEASPGSSPQASSWCW